MILEIPHSLLVVMDKAAVYRHGLRSFVFFSRDQVVVGEQFTHPFSILVLSYWRLVSKAISSGTPNTRVEVTKQETHRTTRYGVQALVHLHV